MNFRKTFIVVAYIGLLLFIFIPFIDQPERVYKEFGLLLGVGVIVVSSIYSYPNVFAKNKHGRIHLVGTNSVSALVIISIILGFFIYRPYIELCKSFAELVPQIAAVLFINYSILNVLIWLDKSKYKINSQNIFILMSLTVVGVNLWWIWKSLPYFAFQIQQTLQCF